MPISNQIRRGSTLALFALALVACQPGSAPTATEGDADARIAGRIDGDEITVAELDRYIKDQLFLRATKGGDARALFEVRESEFQRMASERALEAEALEQSIDSQELLTRESRRGVTVDEAQTRALYEANKAQFQGREYAEVAPTIRSYLERQSVEANAQRYLAGLRDAVRAEFVLERTRVEVAGSGPSVGSDTAPITIVEFSDYECPFCKQAEEAVAVIRERYPDQVRFEYRHFPLEQIHPNARGAAEAASCAESQGRFWEFHELVFQGAPESLESDKLREQAEAAGLDLAAFDACISDRASKERVDGDLQAGREAGVEGTPTFFVNGIPMRGGIAPDDFVKLIDQELERIRAGG